MERASYSYFKGLPKYENENENVISGKIGTVGRYRGSYEAKNRGNIFRIQKLLDFILETNWTLQMMSGKISTVGYMAVSAILWSQKQKEHIWGSKVVKLYPWNKLDTANIAVFHKFPVIIVNDHFPPFTSLMVHWETIKLNAQTFKKWLVQLTAQQLLTIVYFDEL